MSRTVLNVVEEGIESVGLEKISDHYVYIINEFYKKCCVNDPKRGYTSRDGKYNKIYSCLDSRRTSSTLEINISDENVINVKQSNAEFSNILTLSPEPENTITETPNLLRAGILTLEQISSVSYEDDISCFSDKLTISSMKGTLVSFKDEELECFRNFYYNNSNQKMYFYSKYQGVVTENISLDDFPKRLYRKFEYNKKII